jgi:hypothetical protein
MLLDDYVPFVSLYPYVIYIIFSDCLKFVSTLIVLVKILIWVEQMIIKLNART